MRVVVFASLALVALVSVALSQPTPVPEAPAFKYVSPPLPTGDDVIFVENFDDEGCLKRWVPSTKTAFKGKWTFSEGSDDFAYEGDKGLIVDSKAQKHAISARFPKPVTIRDKPLIVQYSVRLQRGLDCGGAYIKLLLADKNRKAEDFSNETPYVIMFGPDRCGATQKTHFILRHQNPLNSEWEEKHYNPAVPPKSDQQSHLYTLEIRPDNQVRIYIDGEQVTAGSLLENMVPPISPPLEIDDPEDKKPADWVDAKTIPDVKAVKPADWDQPKTIFDDNAIKPEDWDDETDGEWEPPEVPNPEYKGEWKAPEIPNPAYKGEWKPKKIPNPHYFVDQHPHNLPEIDGIGFDIWSMNDGIVFDNIIVTTDKAVADKFGVAGFTPRSREESRVVAARKAALEKDTFQIDSVSKAVNTAMQYMGENPIVAAAVVISAIGLLTVFTYACTLVCCPSKEEDAPPAGKKSASKKGKAKESDAESSGDEDDEDTDKKEDQTSSVSSGDSTEVRKRKPAKKD